ncbi:MAG: sigma-54-dependent Fis family transcriptional regulator [bacterium]|nr:sigma-54-dependent Fis family transcriptional regulator [bacterium]
MIKILLVEDDVYIRALIKVHLQKQHYHVDEAPDLAAASTQLKKGDYDVIVQDLKLTDGNSLSLFKNHQEKLNGRTIIITANATVPSVVEAIKLGAFNYLEKPVDNDLLSAQIKKIIEINSLKQVNQTLMSQVASNFNFDTIIYESKKMEAVIERAKILAQTEQTVLIQGETGSGKEVFSQAIHNASPRRNEIFLPVNCASIPGELFESELFGFVKGAFTGAIDSYSGRFVQANNGTLFLDEIGELPLTIQAKLLRVLDDRAIFQLKGKKPVRIDTRLVTATNRDLPKEIKLKQFRSDLYYRLKESMLVIPPLRERVEDILPLVRHFIRVYNHVYKKEVNRLSAAVENFFLTYAWGGNVRELKNAVQSIIPFKTDNTIRMEDLSFAFIVGNDESKDKRLSLKDAEKKHIYRILKLTGFNIKRTADLLIITRPRLYRKMKDYGLEVDEKEAETT